PAVTGESHEITTAREILRSVQDRDVETVVSIIKRVLEAAREKPELATAYLNLLAPFANEMPAVADAVAQVTAQLHKRADHPGSSGSASTSTSNAGSGSASSS